MWEGPCHPTRHWGRDRCCLASRTRVDQRG